MCAYVEVRILEEETGENNTCEVVERKLNRRKNRRGSVEEGWTACVWGFVMVEGVGVTQQIRRSNEGEGEIICSLGMARN